MENMSGNFSQIFKNRMAAEVAPPEIEEFLLSADSHPQTAQTKIQKQNKTLFCMGIDIFPVENQLKFPFTQFNCHSPTQPQHVFHEI